MYSGSLDTILISILKTEAIWSFHLFDLWGHNRAGDKALVIYQTICVQAAFYCLLYTEWPTVALYISAK